MTIKYNYVCSKCGQEYVEQLLKKENQFFTKCQKCGLGEYNEVSNLNGFVILDEQNKVTETIFAKTQNEAETISGKECLRVPDNVHINAGFVYDKTWNVFIPFGLVYEPISKKFMTQEEKDNL